MKRIAIQGIEGSFHDIAAHQFFDNEEIQLICCSSFEQVFQTLREDSTAIGMVAIENTIAGSLLHNYELLRDSGASIVGEHKLRIKHSFLCLPDDDWEDIQEVHSHPVALMQCRDFVLEEGIETNKHNFTRFLVFSAPARANLLRNIMEADKASIVFSLPHEEGSLSHVLSVLSFYKQNLTKIQSLPIIGREWEYLFYVDIQFADYTRYSQAIDAIRPLTSDLKILGEYRHGRESI